MTKEQFIKFKEDFKKGIEAVKLDKKFNKNWKNAGYTSEEDYSKARSEAMNKIKELESGMIEFGKYYKHTLYCGSPFTHWAYYCAKHRLDFDEMRKYINTEYNKMKEPKCNNWSYVNPESRWREVKEILEAYGEEIVHSN